MSRLNAGTPKRFRGGGGGSGPPTTLPELILATQPSSLICYYQCNEVSGPLIDSSPNGINLAVQGSGATYGIAGLNGNAVNGNSTQGWNNAGGPADFTGFMPASTGGMTAIAFIRSPVSPLTLNARRLFGLNVSTQPWSFDMATQNSAGNRSIQSIFVGISPVNMNQLRVDFLPAANQWTMFVIRCNVLPGTDTEYFVSDQDAPLLVDNGDWKTTGVDNLDKVSVNVQMNNNTSFGSQSNWDLQHLAAYKIALTDEELLAIAVMAGVPPV